MLQVSRSRFFERELSELTDPQSCEQGGLVEQPVERSRDRQ